MKVLIAARDSELRSHIERVAQGRGHTTVPIEPIFADLIFANVADIPALRAAASPLALICAVLQGSEEPGPALDAGADDWIQGPEWVEARFRAIESKVNPPGRPFDALPDLVFTIDTRGILIGMNRPLPPGQPNPIGMHTADFVDEPYKEIFKSSIEKAIATGQPQRYEVKGAPDNTHYESWVSPIVRDGRVTAAIICARDITERIRAKEAAARSDAQKRGAEESFKTLLEQLTDMVLLHREGRVVWANPACVKGWGYANAEEMVGMDVLHLVVERERNALSLRIEERLRTGTSPSVERTVLRKDGSERIFESAIVNLVQFEGRDTSLVALRDVTERKEIQERQLASERLASMGSLAACMAHEINNPLTYVIGNLSWVARALAEELEDSSRSLRLEMALADAREGVERVRRIVSDLTALSQLDNDEHRVVDLRRLLESTIGVAFNEIKHRARLEKTYNDMPHVLANEVRLGQLFLDLLLSAARRIPEGAANDNVIAVTASRDTRGWASVEIRVRSSQAMSTTDERALGCLTLAQTIVQGLGGEIQTLPGHEHELRMLVGLPPAPSAMEQPDKKVTTGEIEAPRKRPTPTTRARILVVDDEPVIASTMRRALEGHDIYVVTSGRDALELCRGQAFDLVLCDLMLPDLTGMDLYEQLRRDEAGNEKRIIFMTGGAFTPRAKSFLAKIPNPWVEKPFDVDQIQALVDDYILASLHSSTD